MIVILNLSYLWAGCVKNLSLASQTFRSAQVDRTLIVILNLSYLWAGCAKNLGLARQTFRFTQVDSFTVERIPANANIVCHPEEFIANAVKELATFDLVINPAKIQPSVPGKDRGGAMLPY